MRTMALPTGPYKVRQISNVRVPMPDGVTLATDHYAPVPGGRYPVDSHPHTLSAGRAGAA